MGNSEINNSEPKSENIIVKKSTFNKLIFTIIITSIIAAFLGGYMLGTQTSESSKITINEINDMNLNSQKSTSSQKQFELQTIRNISFDDDPTKGDPNALITIVEFSDFQCPFCAKFHETTFQQLDKEYISTGKVNFVYRDFPIQNSHPNAIPAASASECADDQGKFWEMHDMIFENQGTWKDLQISQAVDLFKQYAIGIELNIEEFNSCVDSGKYIDEIRNDLNDGREYGVTGTPGFFVGNENIGFTKLIGAQPFSSFQKVIDAQLGR